MPASVPAEAADCALIHCTRLRMPSSLRTRGLEAEVIDAAGWHACRAEIPERATFDIAPGQKIRHQRDAETGFCQLLRQHVVRAPQPPARLEIGEAELGLRAIAPPVLPQPGIIRIGRDEAGPPLHIAWTRFHGYEHLVVDGIHYVITAGGGGPRVMLAPERPNDVYLGPECERNELGQIRRPFNYLLIERRDSAIAVTVRGLCTAAAGAAVVESFEISVPP